MLERKVANLFCNPVSKKAIRPYDIRNCILLFILKCNIKTISCHALTVHCSTLPQTNSPSAALLGAAASEAEHSCLYLSLQQKCDPKKRPVCPTTAKIPGRSVHLGPWWESRDLWHASYCSFDSLDGFWYFLRLRECQNQVLITLSALFRNCSLNKKKLQSNQPRFINLDSSIALFQCLGMKQFHHCDTWPCLSLEKKRTTSKYGFNWSP